MCQDVMPEHRITMHHRREGHLLTQTQEEMVLIFCFGLFWMSAASDILSRAVLTETQGVLLGWHSLRAQGQGANSWLAAGRGAADAIMPVVDVRTRRMEGIAGQGQGVRPYPCAIDDAYCIVEEYTFF